VLLRRQVAGSGFPNIVLTAAGAVSNTVGVLIE
jgi:hypothetical protein